MMRSLMFISLAALALTGCGKNDKAPKAGATKKGEMPAAQQRSTRFRNKGDGEAQPASQPAAAAAPTAAAPVAGGTITGTITLPAERAAAAKPGSVLFIIVRQDPGGGGRGPLVAAKRVPVGGAGTFPYAFTLSNADVMMAGTPFAGKMRVEARLDGDGDALSKKPGDLSTAPVATEVGAKGLALALDQAQ